MIKVKLTNEILSKLLEIEKYRTLLENTKVSVNISNKFIKNTRKRSSYASNKIEGNPLSFEQASKAIDSNNRHFLKPEQEIRNYYQALTMLSEELQNKTKFSLNLILKTQKIIVKGESKNKIGLRGPMPPGMVFGVFDNKSNEIEYIPPEYSEVKDLLNELIEYVNESKDHPIIKSAIVHYQLVTIHPFEDGNGRTARIMANYVLSYYGYGFKEIGSLEEYFAFDMDEYYNSLQMGLPVLYYNGRNNPPHSEVWFNYYLRIFLLYVEKLTINLNDSINKNKDNRKLRLSDKSRLLLEYLEDNFIEEYTPIKIAKEFNVTNRTIINWSIELIENGFVKPNIVNERIRTYTLIKKK